DCSREKGKEQKMRGQKRKREDGEEKGEEEEKKGGDQLIEQKRKRVDGEEDTGHPILMDTQKVENEDLVEIDQPVHTPEIPRWDTLRWKARPAFKRICNFLRRKGAWTDLHNLSLV
ncbi:hypothetical protein PMAYCL1PPCAC_27432, partial [Pristionchus mayeri]